MLRRRQDHLTFRGNLKHTRYGWLRLTPAYSVHLVRELLGAPRADQRLLDPFCGTGTTALVCAEQGVQADTTDINPFLLWLAAVKTRSYSEADLAEFGRVRSQVEASLRADADGPSWTPPLSRIEKWWQPVALAALSRGIAQIRALQLAANGPALDLVKIAFCRTLIACANVSFGHQSMSFSRGREEANEPDAQSVFQASCELVAASAESVVLTPPTVHGCDARQLGALFEPGTFTQVITSPPYPNRMSYVRELRPYMFFLGYLSDAPAAGELDWQAIGGTWGAATSRVARWVPSADDEVPFPGFERLVASIERQSPVLSRYVHKYFCDMNRHVRALAPLLRPNGGAHYIVGNSKFYDVMVPVERIFAALFRAAGFERATITKIRKRTSKRELFEYVVSAKKA